MYLSVFKLSWQATWWAGWQDRDPVGQEGRRLAEKSLPPLRCTHVPYK